MEKYFALDGEHLIGSEKDLEYLKYAESYKRTVMILMEVLEKSSSYFHFDVTPLLFNFRHYLELQMTGLILYRLDLNKATQLEFIRFMKKSRETHSLSFYVNNLENYDPNANIPKEIKKAIIDMNQIDKKGDSFRYPESSKGLKHYRKSINPNFYNKLANFNSLKSIIINCIKLFEEIKEGYEIEKYAKYI